MSVPRALRTSAQPLALLPRVPSGFTFAQLMLTKSCSVLAQASTIACNVRLGSLLEKIVFKLITKWFFFSAFNLHLPLQFFILF